MTSKILLVIILIQLGINVTTQYRIPTVNALTSFDKPIELQLFMEKKEVQKKYLLDRFVELYLAYADLLKDRRFLSPSQIKTLKMKKTIVEKILMNLMVQNYVPFEEINNSFIRIKQAMY